MSWGVADQGVSSLTNFAVSIYIARTLGAAQFGAFSLAYVTYSFALNASRGLATDPLMVRVSGTDVPTWRRAAASCTGTAVFMGLATGALVLGAALVLHGTTRLAFVALGLMLPGLLLQDSWRFAFFAVGRGNHAFGNDTIWAIVLFPALQGLHVIGCDNVFWFVFVWGAAANVAALAGLVQAQVIPRPQDTWQWLASTRDLGLRYFAENASQSASAQLRSYGVGLLLGLTVVGYVQAASTLMGPFMVISLGMWLVAVPEAARILRNSPRHLSLFCLLVSGLLAVAGLAWGILLLVLLPRGFGSWLLGPLWRPTYPLILPQTLFIIGAGACGGSGAGLHALGAARRSLRATFLSSVSYLICTIVGAVVAGATGTVWGAAVSMWFGTLLVWWELRAALAESPDIPDGALRCRPGGRHRSPVVPRRLS
jgi:O-antigen/teichoic acid export membrane protein